MVNEINLSRIDLNLLVLFAAVHEEGHVGRAAESLNLTSSAVSHGLNRLRRTLNDPLFLKTPKGVVPTARALELADPIADVLARVRQVVASAEPFDAATSTRRFTIGAPDGISAVFLKPLLEQLRARAPGIDLSVRQVLPSAIGRIGGDPWEEVLRDVESRAIDIAVAPIDEVPLRFASRVLFDDEHFVIAMRAGHPFARKPTLDHYCRLEHLVVSLTRDDRGFVDDALAALGRQRRVAVAVPNFMLALSLLSGSDLVAAMPASLLAAQGRHFGLVSRPAPMRLRRFQMRAVATRSGLMDAGLAWLFELLGSIGQKTKGRSP